MTSQMCRASSTSLSWAVKASTYVALVVGLRPVASRLVVSNPATRQVRSVGAGRHP
jgi:hypothetical protein